MTAWLVLLSSLFFFDAVPVQHTNLPCPFIRWQRTIKNDWCGLRCSSSRSEHILHRGSQSNAGPLSQVKPNYASSFKTCHSEMLSSLSKKKKRVIQQDIQGDAYCRWLLTLYTYTVSLPPQKLIFIATECKMYHQNRAGWAPYNVVKQQPITCQPKRRIQYNSIHNHDSSLMMMPHF